jgi:HSP20 family protein
MAHRGNFPFGPVGVPGVFGLRREIDRLFEDAFGGNAQGGARQGSGQPGAGQTFTPAVDAREEERQIVLHMDLPGVRPEDVDLSVENGLLTVRGQRHQQRKEGQEGRYQFVERSYGSFMRQFHLPQGVDESQISADFNHGELEIRIPKPQQPQPRRIQIGQAQGQGAGMSPGSASAPRVSDEAGAASAPGAGGSPAAGAGALGGSMDMGAAGGMLGGAVKGATGGSALAGGSAGDRVPASANGTTGGTRS